MAAESGAGEPLHALRELVAAELAGPVQPAATLLARAIAERHGPGVDAVLFYGSCLRKQTHEGVLDFYVLVRSARETCPRAWQGLGAVLLPPNVYYLEHEDPELGTLRTKYALLRTRDFERLCGSRALHPYIWARFAQPARCVLARDDALRARVSEAVAEAVVTLVRRLSPFLRARGGSQRFRLAALWQEAFRRTYTTELRGESGETIRGLYEADAARYDRAGGLALEVLRIRGWARGLQLREHAAELTRPGWARARERLAWHAARPLAKVLVFLRLLKTAFTFGDWVPYVLWKIERHSGRRVETTALQRRHPLVFGWPVFFRLLRERALR